MAVRKPVKNICLHIPLLRRIIIKQQGKISEKVRVRMPQVPNQSFQTDAGNSFAKVRSGIENSATSFQQLLTILMGSSNVT